MSDGAKSGFMAGTIPGVCLAIITVWSFIESKDLLRTEFGNVLAVHPESISVSSLLKFAVVIGPITIFMMCTILGLLFGLLYHYLWIKNPDLKVIYTAGIGILFGTFFGLTTNLPPLSRAKTLVLSLILGFVYAIALFGIHLRYEEYEGYEGYKGDGIKGIQISILKLIKYKKIAKFEELDEELKIGIDVLNEMEKSGLILLDYKNRYKLTDLGNIMLGRSEGDGDGEGETKEGGVLYFILISYAIYIIIALVIYFMGG